jgi:hypothetical protein
MDKQVPQHLQRCSCRCLGSAARGREASCVLRGLAGGPPMVDTGSFLVHTLLAVAAGSTVAICLTSLGLVALVSGVRCKQLENWKPWRASQSRVLRLLALANLADPLAYAAVWRVAATHRCRPPQQRLA